MKGYTRVTFLIKDDDVDSIVPAMGVLQKELHLQMGWRPQIRFTVGTLPEYCFAPYDPAKNQEHAGTVRQARETLKEARKIEIEDRADREALARSRADHPTAKGRMTGVVSDRLND